MGSVGFITAGTITAGAGGTENQEGQPSNLGGGLFLLVHVQIDIVAFIVFTLQVTEGAGVFLFWPIIQHTFIRSQWAKGTRRSGVKFIKVVPVARCVKLVPIMQQNVVHFAVSACFHEIRDFLLASLNYFILVSIAGHHEDTNPNHEKQHAFISRIVHSGCEGTHQRQSTREFQIRKSLLEIPHSLIVIT